MLASRNNFLESPLLYILLITVGEINVDSKGIDTVGGIFLLIKTKNKPSIIVK
jgi:hypothetical protein